MGLCNNIPVAIYCNVTADFVTGQEKGYYERNETAYTTYIIYQYVWNLKYAAENLIHFVY